MRRRGRAGAGSVRWGCRYQPPSTASPSASTNSGARAPRPATSARRCAARPAGAAEGVPGGAEEEAGAAGLLGPAVGGPAAGGAVEEEAGRRFPVAGEDEPNQRVRGEVPRPVRRAPQAAKPVVLVRVEQP